MSARMAGLEKLALMLALAAPLALPSGASAQAPVARAGAAVRYESYSFGSPEVTGASSVSLLSIPFAARVDVARGLALEVSGAAARASVAAWGTSFSLSGLTDTQLRATLAREVAGTSLALAAVGLVPSGHATLSLEEAVVAGAVASDLLPYRISNWGSGGGAGAELTAIRPLPWGSAGITASYRASGEFQPFDLLAVRYRPGSEVRFGAALDRTLGGDRTLAVQVAYSRFGDDRWAGIRLLHSGDRVLGLVSYSAPAGRGSVSGYGGVLYRSGGALADAIDWAGVLSGITPPSEALFVLGGSARLPWRARVLRPGVDFRLLRRNDGTGQGLLVGLGGAAELPLGDGGVRLVPSARLRLGRLRVAEGAVSAVRGLEVGLGFELGGAR